MPGSDSREPCQEVAQGSGSMGLWSGAEPGTASARGLLVARRSGAARGCNVLQRAEPCPPSLCWCSQQHFFHDASKKPLVPPSSSLQKVVATYSPAGGLVVDSLRKQRQKSRPSAAAVGIRPGTSHVVLALASSREHEARILPRSG